MTLYIDVATFWPNGDVSVTLWTDDTIFYYAKTTLNNKTKPVHTLMMVTLVIHQQRTHNLLSLPFITSKQRLNDTATSFWRNDDLGMSDELQERLCKVVTKLWSHHIYASIISYPLHWNYFHAYSTCHNWAVSDDADIDTIQVQCPYSLSRRTSYRKISWRLDSCEI